MKKLMPLLLIVVFFTCSIFSQVPAKDFNEAEVFWYGLDFSQAKLVGSAGFTDPEAIRNDFFEKWNSLILVEADKYDLKGAFKKPALKYDAEMIKAINMKVDHHALVQDKSHAITKEDVENAVKQYNTDQKEGYGLVFVVESFDKIQEKAFVWVTVFDVSNKKILITERMEGEPRGFGLRNYWAGAIYEIITDIRKVKYKSWFR